jgi:hypothetical protein
MDYLFVLIVLGAIGLVFAGVKSMSSKGTGTNMTRLEL